MTRAAFSACAVAIAVLLGSVAATEAACQSLNSAISAQSRSVSGATSCAPRDSLWLDLINSEIIGDASAPALVTINLKGATGRIQPTVDDGRIITGANNVGGQQGTPAPTEIRDLSALFTGNHRISVGIAAGEYFGTILPPGSNNELVPGRPEVDTGRAGAIFLIPVANQAEFCSREGTPGYIIHSGSPTDRNTLAGLPSLLVEEDKLAQLIADVLSLLGPSQGGVGRPYEEVAVEIAGPGGAQSFRPFRVNLRREGDRVREALASEGQDSAPPPFPLLSYSNLKEIQFQIVGGYRTLLSRYASMRDGYFHLLGKFQNLEAAGNLEERRGQLQKLRQSGDEVLAMIPEHLRIIRMDRDAGRLPNDPLIEQHIKMVEQDAAMFAVFEQDIIESVSALERLDEDGYLNQDRELAPPSVRASEDCVLVPIRIRVPSRIERLFGQEFRLSGDLVLYWTREPTAHDTFIMRIRSLMNVSDLLRVQSSLVRSGLKNDDCGERQSASNDRLHANARGELDGRSDLASEFRACFTFKYPCFKGWKIYSCRKQTWTRLATIRSAARFTISSRAENGLLEFRVTGVLSAREAWDPIALIAADPRLQDVANVLSIKPRRSFFSEDLANLYFVAELSGAPKSLGIACGMQSEIQEWSQSQ